MIRGLRDIYVNVSDMRRSIAFYRDILGIPVSSETTYWTSLDLYSLRLGLHWTGGTAVPSIPADEHGPFSGATITFEVPEMDKFVEHLKQSGVSVGPILTYDWGRIVTLADPDGNILKALEPVPARD
ncbi:MULTISPECIES: VOC family protein [Rhizobium]|uniref:VOC family protein n=1 Tax=Rhizobium TaxID=379 RepID=UPI0039BF5917